MFILTINFEIFTWIKTITQFFFQNVNFGIKISLSGDMTGVVAPTPPTNPDFKLAHIGGLLIGF